MLNLIEESGLEDYVEIESAGVSDEHEGQEPDPRSQECAIARGLSLETTAAQFTEEDFDRFDYILPMDIDNRDVLISLAPNPDAEERIFLLRAFEPGARSQQDVPDPYFGGANGFDEVFDIVDTACNGLLEHLIEHHDLPD